MNRTAVLLFFALLSGLTSKIDAQTTNQCNLQSSNTINATVVDKNDIICIAKNSEKPYTIFYTLASWCSPCRLHFPDALELQKSEKVDLFVVLVEAEKDKRIGNAVNFINSFPDTVKFGVLKDELYGTKVGKRNSKFATEITPEHNEMIPDYGKFILIDKSGKVLYVTNWKDYNKDWKNAGQMLNRTILPLIK